MVRRVFRLFCPLHTVALVLIMWLIITDKKQVLLDATQEWKKQQHFSTHNAPLSLTLSQSVAIKNSAAKISVLAVIMCAPRTTMGISSARVLFRFHWCRSQSAPALGDATRITPSQRVHSQKARGNCFSNDIQRCRALMGNLGRPWSIFGVNGFDDRPACSLKICPANRLHKVAKHIWDDCLMQTLDSAKLLLLVSVEFCQISSVLIALFAEGSDPKLILERVKFFTCSYHATYMLHVTLEKKINCKVKLPELIVFCTNCKQPPVQFL